MAGGDSTGHRDAVADPSVVTHPHLSRGTAEAHREGPDLRSRHLRVPGTRFSEADAGTRIDDAEYRLVVGGLRFDLGAGPVIGLRRSAQIHADSRIHRMQVPLSAALRRHRAVFRIDWREN